MDNKNSHHINISGKHKKKIRLGWKTAINQYQSILMCFVAEFYLHSILVMAIPNQYLIRPTRRSKKKKFQKL